MPRYYFNVTTAGRTFADPEGTELDDLEAARAEAIDDARAAMSEAIRCGIDLSRRAMIEICDADGSALLRVPYSEAILPLDIVQIWHCRRNPVSPARMAAGQARLARSGHP